MGYEERLKKRLPLVMLPIDRIDNVNENDNHNGKGLKRVKFKELDPEIDIDDYFYDIVGVSLNPESKPVRIVLKVGYPDAEYLVSKPIHGSQRVVNENEDENENGLPLTGYSLPHKVFELRLIPNEEFMQQLLAYAHNAEVIEPLSLREKLLERAKKMIETNKILP